MATYLSNRKIRFNGSYACILTDSTWAFLCLVFINIWFGAPMIMVNVLSALQTVPEEQFEAAKIDGASSWQVFKFIVFPHIKVV